MIANATLSEGSAIAISLMHYASLHAIISSAKKVLKRGKDHGFFTVYMRKLQPFRLISVSVYHLLVWCLSVQ
jgi:hypothetical protein